MRLPARVVLVLLLVVTAAAPLTGHAASFSSIQVFGDSLSDNGNLFAAIGYPPSPYYQGRFSNGPVAVEQLASLLGVPLADYAFGGATSGIGNLVDGGTQTSFGQYHLPGTYAEVAAVLGTVPTPGKADPNALYVVWAGANDYQTGDSAIAAANNILSIVNLLKVDGARNILVPNLPDLSKTPEFYGVGSAKAFTTAFNATLKNGLSGATLFDTEALLNSLIANPAFYGLTNVTTPCITNPSACSTSLFFDDIHPTTTVDTIVARQFAAAVTPEPSSLVLLVTGISGLTVAVRRRMAS